MSDLKSGIASFYDESSELWESMWGEHMHHGGLLWVGGWWMHRYEQKAERAVLQQPPEHVIQTLRNKIAVNPRCALCNRAWLLQFPGLAAEHAGYYPKGAPVKSNQEAQIDMIEESLKVGGCCEADAVREWDV